MAASALLAGEAGTRTLSQHFDAVRAYSLKLCEPLQIEDYGLQPMADASPAKWHLAHTTWFFETFLLKPQLPGYQCRHERYEFLFNSYYNGVGDQFDRTLGGPYRGQRWQKYEAIVTTWMRRCTNSCCPCRTARMVSNCGRTLCSPAPRAAAPGTVADGPQIRLWSQPAASRL